MAGLKPASPAESAKWHVTMGFQYVNDVKNGKLLVTVSTLQRQ
jgi:hypothetical protein